MKMFLKCWRMKKQKEDLASDNSVLENKILNANEIDKL